MRARSWICALVAAGAMLAGPAPVARAQTAGEKAAFKVFQDYVIDGRIDPCRHSSKELQLALDNVPPDIEQYAADYPSAIEAAIKARARGDCAGQKPATGLILPPTTPSPTPVPTPVPTAIPTKTVVPEPPAPEASVATPTPATTATPQAAEDLALERVATARPANAAPAPVLLLGLLVALLALTALAALAVARVERLAGARHALGELTWRAGGTWADFRDWLRLGR